jgi:acetolactate synthase-1/2/3 large subunit
MQHSHQRVRNMLNTEEHIAEQGKQARLEKTGAERSGAEILVDVLNDLDVEYIFGHTGGAVIPIHVELNVRMEKNQKAPRFVLFRQEGGAGHAAEGYARVSGRVGVALATSGPGSTNLVTPIADAYKDSIPCVFITGQVPSTMIGNDAFQEVDMVGITRPISKHNFLIKSVSDLEPVLRQAFHIARTGRPGPVVVDICKNTLLAKSATKHKLRMARSYHPEVRMDEKAALALLQALLSAKRPVVKAGGGVISANASRELRQFVDKYSLPTTLTFMGLGALNHDSKLFLGMPGMHGTVGANYALKQADFILALGSRFDDRVAVKEFGRGLTIAHVDVDHAEIGKTISARYEVHANVKDFLDFALKTDLDGPDLSEWLSTIRSWSDRHPLSYEPGSEYVKPQYFIEELSRLTNKTSTVITGVGQHQMWTALYYNFQESRQWISSGGLGTMGFGLPAAIGAYFANPDKTVLCIDGDGSFQMNIQELATIAANKLPIKIFILNNGFLGMVRQWEDMFDQGHHYETCLSRTSDCDPACVDTKQCRYPNPNFLHLSKVYPGIKTLRITKTEDVTAGIEHVLGENKPYIVDVWIDRTEDVKPMIPPGGTLGDIILS